MNTLQLGFREWQTYRCGLCKLEGTHDDVVAHLRSVDTGQHWAVWRKRMGVTEEEE